MGFGVEGLIPCFDLFVLLFFYFPLLGAGGGAPGDGE